MMHPLLSDAQFNSVALVIIALIGLIGTSLTAYWSRGAKKSSDEAKSDAQEAKENSAQALHEVSTNGGMSDPNPNLNDHVKYQTEMMEWLVRDQQQLRRDFRQHLKHSSIMDQALAELYLKDRPTPVNWPDDDLPQPPSN